MSNNNKEKGNALERVVRLVQKTILEQDPKFAGVKFSIEMNQILKVNDVRHEVDVLVKTHPDSQFEALWIYECKNWQEPVGKNEIIIFAEKVKVLGAARGFMVAKEFTKDAKAQAEADRRIQLVPFSEDFINPLNAQLLYNVIAPSSIVVRIKERNKPPSPNPNPVDMNAVVCLHNGNKRDFYSFIMDHIGGIVAELKKESKFLNEGEFCEPKGVDVYYPQGELVLNGMDIEQLVVFSHFWISTQRKKIMSKFELKDQGRVYFIEPIEDLEQGQKIQIDIVQRL
jgi:Restriction endonuclease